MDTNPAYALLVRKVKTDREGKEFRRELLWASPRYERGHLVTAAVDFDGDGTPEIVVVTQRQCEGKGQIIVFKRKSPAPPPGR